MATLTQWDPFRELTKFASLLSPLGSDSQLMESKEWAPAVDIAEDDKAFHITADLPDVEKNNVHVTAEKGYLTISGERRHESEDQDSDKKYHRIERKFGSYVRRFALPDHVDVKQISAKFSDGVLNVVLPKIEEESGPVSLDIKVD